MDGRFKLAGDGQKLKALEIGLRCIMSKISQHRFNSGNSNWKSRFRALAIRQHKTGTREALCIRELLLIWRTILRHLTLPRLLTTTGRETLSHPLVMPYTHTLTQEVGSHAQEIT